MYMFNPTDKPRPIEDCFPFLSRRQKISLIIVRWLTKYCFVLGFFLALCLQIQNETVRFVLQAAVVVLATVWALVGTIEELPPSKF